MAAMDLWKRGNKRRVAQIRWKRREIVFAILLTFSMLAFCLWLGYWMATHPFD